MTISLNDRRIVRSGRDGGLRAYPVAAAKLLPHGRAVFTDAASGFATNTSDAGANRFAGIAALRSDNSAGSNGDTTVEVFNDGAYEMVGSGFTQADVGKPVFLADNGDGLTKTATDATHVGKVTEFKLSTTVMVELATNPTYIPA